MSAREIPDVPSELQALYEAEKARPGPSPVDRDAVYTALAASCGVAAVAAGVSSLGTGAVVAGSSGTAAGASAGATAASSAGIASSLPALLVKPMTLLIFAAGAVTGTGTTLLVEHVATSPKASPVQAVARKAPTPRKVTLPPPSVLEPPAPEAPTVAAPQPTPAEEKARPTPAPPRPLAKRAGPTRRPRTPGKAPRSPSANTSVVERNLLEHARTALSRGEAGAALRALQQHRKRYPRGTLAEERAALMVVALADLGHGKRARAAARAFKKRHPQSLLLPLVNDALKRASTP